MTQYARPVSDVAVDSWTYSTGATLFGCIDETSYSDTDYIASPYATSFCEIGLGSVTDPVGSVNHIINYRWRQGITGGASYPSAVCKLYCGTTLITTITPADPGDTAYHNETYTLSAAEANNITDYANLRFRFSASVAVAGKSNRVSWAEFQCPNATISNTVIIPFTPNASALSINPTLNAVRSPTVTVPNVANAASITLNPSVMGQGAGDGLVTILNVPNAGLITLNPTTSTTQNPTVVIPGVPNAGLITLNPTMVVDVNGLVIIPNVPNAVAIARLPTISGVRNPTVIIPHTPGASFVTLLPTVGVGISIIGDNLSASKIIATTLSGSKIIATSLNGSTN